MSATEVLRRLLDERGVEWDDDGYPTTCTVWASDGIVWHGLWRDDCIELIAHLTPKQAIAATLGQGTCRNTAPSYLDFLCSECGFVHYHSDTNDTGDGNEWCFCPNCGAKIVDPATNDVDAEVDA